MSESNSTIDLREAIASLTETFEAAWVDQDRELHARCVRAARHVVQAEIAAAVGSSQTMIDQLAKFDEILPADPPAMGCTEIDYPAGNLNGTWD